MYLREKDPAGERHSYWHITRFYFPLFIQAAAQTLTYPLVGYIVARGKLEAAEYAAFAQAHTYMFFLGAISGGLIATGMVFGRNKTGFTNFRKLNISLGLFICALQLLSCVPPFDTLLFSKLLNLDAASTAVARFTLLASIPMHFCFIVRNEYMAVLYNHKKSALANTATIARMVATFLLMKLFSRLEWLGCVWGSVALSLPVLCELVLTRKFALPFIRALADTQYEEKASVAKQLHFTIPLSFGGMMLSASSFIIPIFLGRTPDPAIAVSVHYVVMAIANPLGLGALRTQPTVIGFPPKSDRDTRMLKFSLGAGLVLGLFTLVAQHDGIARWYFGTVQNLSADGVAFAKRAILWMAFLPFLQSVRGYVEGLAALRRRTNAILAGQAMYLATMISTLFMLQSTNLVPGYMMGTTAILCALAVSLVTVRIGIIRTDFEDSYGNPARRFEPDE